MAEDKKGFLIYADYIHIFEGLEDDEAGRLAKHLFRYVNDLNPTPPDKLTQIAFEPIKQQLKRDLVKWEKTKEKRSDAGYASAEAKKAAKLENQQPSTKSTHVESVEHNSTNLNKPQQEATKSTVSVNDNVNVNVNGNVNEIDNEIKNKQREFDEKIEEEKREAKRLEEENKKKGGLTPELYPTFYDFWNNYDKKIGQIEKVKKKWNELKQAEKEKIIEYIPLYRAAQPNKRYRKNPETFLNNQSWNDEIITTNNNGKSDSRSQSVDNLAQESIRLLTGDR